jgi:hypothetical protein
VNPGVAEALETLYASLPRLNCRRLCAEACGPIDVSVAEWERMEAALPPIEAGPRFDVATMSCGFLDLRQGLCRIYAARPLICRLWGLVKRMRCPHGCEPERWVSDEESGRLFADALRLSGDKMVTHAPPAVLRELRRWWRVPPAQRGESA